MVDQEESHCAVVLKWRDTKDVLALSAKHGPMLEEAFVRKREMPVLAASATSTSSANRASSKRAKSKSKPLIKYNI